MAFCWRANVGLHIVVFRLQTPHHLKKNIVKIGPPLAKLSGSTHGLVQMIRKGKSIRLKRLNMHAITCNDWNLKTTLKASESEMQAFIKPCNLQKKNGPEVIKHFSCSTQPSTKFQLLIKTKILTNKEVSCFKSPRCCIYHADKCWCQQLLEF